MATRVKACGITRAADARAAVELGAWALGLIFHEPSPRACAPADAAGIGAELRREVELAGVFVNHPLEQVTALAEACSLSILQLHGDEGPAYCSEAARRTGCRVMKAVRVKDAASVRRLGAFRAVDLHLLDSHAGDRRGGTGESFDWSYAAGHPRTPPLVLSGGLRPENVGEAIARVRPFAVDSASGTEAAPGRKDPELLRAFFDAVEVADARAAASSAPAGAGA